MRTLGEIDVDAQRLNVKADHLRPYKRPTLVFFGQVRDLTMAGGSLVLENTSPGNTSKCAQNYGACLPSDRSVKHRIQRIGEHRLGFGLYLFNYRPEYQADFGSARQFGVMADEVEAVVPEAVLMHPLGIKMVDYGMLGIGQAIHSR